MARCFGDGDPLYADYHDTEWGEPPSGFGANEAELFERLSLEVFQVGLSWLLILRRREAFRQLFHDFDPTLVARMNTQDLDRLADNPAIIRNRAKIAATISNAQALLDMHSRGESLAELIAVYRPTRAVNPRANMADVPASTPESIQLTAALKQRGFKFVGPVNVYAMMQALGVVNDHLATCPITLVRANNPQPLSNIWDEVRKRTSNKHSPAQQPSI